MALIYGLEKGNKICTEFRRKTLQKTATWSTDIDM
jgi:hypothetical protein